MRTFAHRSLSAAVLSLSLASVPVAAQAEDQATGEAVKYGGGWVAGLFLEAGGEDVYQVLFVDGTYDTLTTADGYGFNVGGHYRPQDTKFDLSGTIGIKRGDIVGSNATISITRKVIEIRADYFITDNVWVGAGPVFHKGIKGDGGGLAPDVKFSDATGFNVRIGWKWLAFSHTSMDYSVPGAGTGDASSNGLVLQGRF